MWLSLPLHLPVNNEYYYVRTAFSKSLTFLAKYNSASQSFVSVDNNFTYPIYCFSQFQLAECGVGFDVIGGNFRVWA